MKKFESHNIGVYRIVHLGSGRFYIGSSKNIPVRFSRHKSMLRAGNHHSKFLQSVWNKNKGKEFVFQVVLNCRTWSDALDHEQSLLDEFYGKPECMNGSRRARMPILDPDVMERARKAANCSAAYIDSHRDVCIRRNADPEFQRAASDALRKSEKHKSAVKNNALLLQRPEVYLKNREVLRNSKAQKDSARAQAVRLNSDPAILAKNRAATCRAVVGVHIETGEVIRFPSQSAAARSLGIYSSNISMCCSGKIHSIKGYRWHAG